MRLADASLPFGKAAVATGRLGSASAGRTVVLEHRGADGQWRAIGDATVARDGRYRVRGSVPVSGALRVTLKPSADSATAAASSASSERAVSVLTRIGVGSRRLDVKAGRSALVAGRIAPRVGGRTVWLQVRRGGRWTTIDRATTRRGGRFVLRDRQTGTRSLRARVVAQGSAEIAGGGRVLGRLNVYRTAHASWYGPGLYGNQLGCGGRLGAGTLGVAHKTLPCGTKVTLRHRGRSVSVRVIDRGPYVGGREYDLTAATARRIGFTGHGPVLVTR